MACYPNNTPPQTCEAQLLALNDSTGDLAITSGNTINLATAIQNLQTETLLSSFTLTGTILQIIYVGEDGVQQAKNVDLAPILPQLNTIGIENSNSIHLSYDGVNLRADLIIDPASTAPVTASAAGVNIGCCPELPITANTTNTIQLVAAGTAGHVLSSNLKYQSSPSLLFLDTSAGFTGSVKFSTDASNALISGSDGGLFVQSACSQLGSLSNNGFVSTGTSGTLLVGSDCKLYRLPDAIAESPITGVNTSTIDVTIGGPNNHTIEADLNFVTSNTIQLSATLNGLQADLKIDSTQGNILLTETSNGLVANANAATIQGIQSTAATVQNPLIKAFGTLNNNAAGYANVFISQYGIKIPSFTTSQRISIPGADLYDDLLVFDSNLRAYMWYDAINNVWVQLGSGSSTPVTPTGSTVKVTGVVDSGGSPFVSGNTYVNNAMANLPVLVYRNKLMEPDINPGNGDSYFTKTLSSNTITFSTALTTGELIQIIILPS